MNLPFTIEEENLLCIFDISSRTALINDLRATLPDFDEREICEIAENVLKKLAAISDAEFAGLIFAPEYVTEETEI